MIAADRPGARQAALLVLDAGGSVRHLPRAALSQLFRRGDLVVANDAATLPASLHGIHLRTGAPIEIRLAGWLSLHDATGFFAIAFGGGDHRTPTEDRAAPPPLLPGDRLALGPLTAVIERTLGHPRLIVLHFLGSGPTIYSGLSRHGRPIQYAHVARPLALGEVWTPVAANPVAFEAPSAGFALDWQTLARWRGRGIRFATLTHAAGISSTGDPALDRRLPFDEPYRIPQATAAAIAETRAERGRVIAIGTTVVRALEAAAVADAAVRAGEGVARGRIGPDTHIGVVDAVLTGVHAPGESHFQLLRAFTDDTALDRAGQTLARRGYRTHEFGDSLLVERAPRPPAAASAGVAAAFTML